MKRLRQLVDGPSEDRGAALILVLFVVTVIGLAGTALLTFSDTSIRTTVALRDQAGNAHNADGAAQVAIDSLSTGYGFTGGKLFTNGTGEKCFGVGSSSGTRNLADFYPGTSGRSGTAPSSASVTCLADPDTGSHATVVPISSKNRPGQAIMTLGPSTSEDGINIAAPSTTKAVAVKGAVKSNSNIRVATGTLQSTAAVTAFGECTGSIVSTPTANCETGTSLVDPFLAAPTSYASDATTVPAYQPVPPDVLASCPQGVVTFLPGYYDNAKALTSLMTGSGPCGGSTWWFKPGTYYFDFHNNLLDRDAYRGAATSYGRTANQWSITRGNLVAGTPTDANGNVIPSPGASPTFPGSCQNPIKSITAAGVQFNFGGDSQLAIGGSADAEICGTYHDDRPSIALYGVRSGAAETTILDGTGSTATAGLKMSTVPTQTTKFQNPEGIEEQDNLQSRWAKSSSNADTSTVTVSGYAPPSAIPAGSIVKEATVRVRHRNTAKYDDRSGKDKLTVTFTPKGVTGSPPATAVTLTPDLPDSNTMTTDDLVVHQPGDTSAFANYVHDNGFTGADMAYTARLTHKGNEELDTIQIDISYVTPAFRSQNVDTFYFNSNCMRQVYTRTSNFACAVLSTSVEALAPFTGAFYVQGTIYAPLAAVDLTLNNATQQILPSGLISRSLWFKENASFSYPDPVIEMPDDSASGNGDPIVFLTVFICPAKTTSTCSADTVDPADPERGPIRALQVKARIEDSSSPPSSSTRRMTILSWSNLR